MAEQEKQDKPAKPAKKSEDSVLVPMVKQDATLEVHPSCVKAHEKAGWRVAE